MNTQDVIRIASKDLLNLQGQQFGVISLNRPTSINAALNLSRIISKLSPFVGNLIEFNTVEYLNTQGSFESIGTWKRQDPGFPDAIFDSSILPAPGFEIKAWFPLATEITARFKDSQDRFDQDQVYVVLQAWLPENVIFGAPQVIDICIVSGYSVALARDTHYHDPPDYIVLEPEDTSARPRNLQQSNTNGYKWQGTPAEFFHAQQLVKSWGADGKTYKTSREYQDKWRDLQGRYKYRLETNYAKIDRIAHPGIEQFKTKVLQSTFKGMRIGEWARALGGKNETRVQPSREILGFKKAAIPEQLLEAVVAPVEKSFRRSLRRTPSD